MIEKSNIRVNLDVMGWDAALSAHHEAECLKIAELAKTAVGHGYDAMELAEAIDEYQQARLFKQITVSINRRETTVVTLFAIGVEKAACQ